LDCEIRLLVSAMHEAGESYHGIIERALAADDSINFLLFVNETSRYLSVEYLYNSMSAATLYARHDFV
jgi:hypothetical protein